MTARTALKVAATEGLKKPPERRWPEGAPPVTHPRRSRRQWARDGPLCPASFPATPIPLQGADPSPSVSPTTQNDRQGKGLFSCFHISRKYSIFFSPGLNSSFPCFYVFSDRKKGKSRRGPRAGPRQAGGLRQGGRRGSGLKVPSGGAPRCPRRCPPS